MPNKSISNLDPLTAPSGDDLVPITDISDTTGSANGTTKRVTVENLISKNLTVLTETGTTRTLANSDIGKVIHCTNSAQVTITVPSGLASGFNCTLVQGGAGVVVVEAGTNASVAGRLQGGSSLTATQGIYSAINLVPVGSDSYVISGDSGVAPFLNASSLLLDGADDYVDVGTIPEFNSVSTYSVSAWFKTNFASEVTIMGAYQHFYRVRPSSGGIGYRINGTNGTNFGNANYLDNQWHQFVLTYNSGAVVAYVDGSQIGTHTNNATTNSNVGNNFKIGTYSFSSGSPVTNYFQGGVDEVGIWTSALSASEVTEIYASGNVIDLSSDTGNYTSSANLAHWWRGGDADSGAGTNLTDSAGSVDGTLTNGAQFSSDVP